MAVIACAMNLFITGTIATSTGTLDYEVGIWKACKKAQSSDTWSCFDYADGSSIPYATVADDGSSPKLETLQGLYVSAVVLLFVGNCFAFGGYTGKAKISCQLSALFSSVASILFLSTAIWVTCRTTVPAMGTSVTTPATGTADLGWNYTYVYLWIGWLLCNGSAASSMKAAKDCDESPDEHASHQPETTVGKV
jgi:hypothetical protein